ncbi:MAG: hypothetical protein ACREQA_24235, partial [Candidatus Binatia bacterium]
LAFVLENLRGTLQTVDEVEKALQIPVLATLPRMNHNPGSSGRSVRQVKYLEPGPQRPIDSP